jgi:hypothetical protein
MSAQGVAVPIADPEKAIIKISGFRNNAAQADNQPGREIHERYGPRRL